jgi:phage shock protein A
MTLINRVARLFRADLHAILDRLEEPEPLLRQALREMEEAQGRDHQRLRRLDQAAAQAAGRRADLDKVLAEAGDQVDACLANRQDDLARNVIRRRLEAEQALKALTRRAAELESERTQLVARLRDNATRLETMRQKVEVLAGQEAEGASEWRTGQAWDDLGLTPEVGVQAADVELALLRAKQGRAPA